MVTRIYCLFTVCCALMLLAQVSQAASARLSATQIYQYETVQLELIGSDETPPDLSALEKDFEIQGRSSQRSMQIINGQLQASAFTLTLTLQPLRTGVLEISPITLGNEQTNALRLEVKAIDAATQGSIDRKAFFEIEVSNETPYQGQAVFLTRSLFYAPDVQIYGSLPGLPEMAGASVQPAGEPRASVGVIDGERFNVYVSEYVLFPDQPGRLVIPEIEVMARLQVTLGSGRRALGVPIRGSSAVLDVRPPPAAFPVSKPWLPARDLRIESEFSVSRSEVNTPLTFDVRVSLEDALASHVAPLDLAFPASIKSYPESPRLEDDIAQGRVRGQRLERYSLVPTAPGIFTLPEVRIAWWDTERETLRETSLPAREIEILPDPNAPPEASLENFETPLPADAQFPDSTTADKGGFDAWHGALLLLCGLLGVGWYVSSRPALWRKLAQRQSTDVKQTPEAGLFERIEGARNLAESLIALRAWLGHVELEPEMRASCEDFLARGEASLYAAQHTEAEPSPATEELEELLRALAKYRKAWLRQQAKRPAPALPGLYGKILRSPSSP